ncbi:hypothetical protein CJF31_00004971 [Rutstroemia sp. NJR-2017a BVV2]|nr:hypothetical protein CJF31_00004971 [Rutstroemia sp. NJR-2017a BVV2]
MAVTASDLRKLSLLPCTCSIAKPISIDRKLCIRLKESNSLRMAGWDPSTIASVTALIVAALAMIIALAQAVQQYFITGQLIRICDSVVFGPMPGQGRRVWQLSQFRFRVLYSIPQISLSADLWPSDSGLVKSYAIGRHPLPRLAGSDDDIHEIPRWLVKVERRREWKAKARRFLMRLTPWRREPSVEEEDYGNMQVIVGHPVVPTSKRRRFFQRGRFKRKLFFWSRWTRSFRRKLFSASWWSSLVTGGKAHTSFTPSTTISSVTSSSARSAAEIVDSRRVGEASWVSFCRAIEMPCGNSVRFDHVQYDADRCPSDLVSAPMQVSMRDIIIMGLMAGMGITSASFNEKSVSMQGAAGTITTSKHAVLGPILHFTPRNTDENPISAFGYSFGHRRGFVDGYWLVRTWGVCCVARRYFNWKSRRTARRLDDRWIREQEDSTWNPHDGSTGDGARQSGNRKYASHRRDKNGWMGGIVRRHSVEKTDSSHRSKKPGAEGEETNERGKQVIKISRAIPERLPQDGNWRIFTPPPPTLQGPPSAVNQQGHANKLRQEANISTNKKPETHNKAHTAPGPPGPPSQEDATPEDRLRPPRPTRRATVEDASDHEGEFPSNGPMPEARNLPLGTEAVAKAGFEEPSEKSTPTPPTISHRVVVESETRSREAKETVVSSAEEERLERTDVGDDKELSERVQTAKKLQATRAEKLRQVRHDKEIVQDSVKRGVIHPPHKEAAGQRSQLLLTNYAHNEKDASKEDEEEDEGGSKPTKEEQEAQERESKRAQDRIQRDNEREERNQARNRSFQLDKVDLYWMSQMDVMRGYWATPWHRPSTTPVYSALSGCVTVVLEALLGFLGSEYIAYRSGSFYATAAWMYRRSFGDDEGSYNHTYPAYAQNARGGVIASGDYVGCRITSFSSRVIPVLELAHSYDWQVEDSERDQTEVEEQNVELMRIDSWLSYVGRLDEISEGPHRLLHQTPALVQLLMEEFEGDFQNIDLSAKEGGLQDIQGLAANVMDFLTDEELTEAEQLYVLVALLRSVKVTQCVLSGSDTADLQSILENDVQAHLV